MEVVQRAPTTGCLTNEKVVKALVSSDAGQLELKSKAIAHLNGRSIDEMLDAFDTYV